MNELASFNSWAVTEKGVEHIRGHYCMIPKWALYSRAVLGLAAYLQRGRPWLIGEELFSLTLAIRKARQLFTEPECKEALKVYKVKS